MTASTAGVGEDEGEDLPRYVRAVAEPSMSTGFVVLASAGRTPASCSLVLVRQRRELEPGSLTGVGAENAEPARIRDHGDAVATGCRLRREKCGDIEKLCQRVCAKNAGLAEQRVDRRVRSGERSGVRAGGPATGGASGRSSSQGSASCAQGVARGARTSAGSRTTRGTSARRRCFSSSSHHSSRSFDETSALFPIETKAETPSPRASARSSSASPSAPALRGEPDPARRERARREGRVEPDRRRRDPEAVRPHQAGTVRAHECEQVVLACAALGPDLRKPGRDDAEGLRPVTQRDLGGPEHVLAGDADHDEVERVRDLGDRVEGLAPRRPARRCGSRGRRRR